MIDLKLFFLGEKTLEYGFNYRFVNERDLHVVRNTPKNNLNKKGEAIQINFKDEAMMWDLSNNSEITSLTRIQDFSRMENYVRTGFTYYKLSEI